jgi:hypothetical protein
MATENDVETRLGKRIYESYAEEAGDEYARKHKAMKQAVAQYEEEEKALSEKCNAASYALQDVMRKKRAAIQAFDEDNFDLNLSTFYAITAREAGTVGTIVRWVWKHEDATFVIDAVLKLVPKANIAFDIDSVRLGDVNEKRERDLRGATTLQDIIHGFLEFFKMRIYSIALSIPTQTRYEVFKSASEATTAMCRFFAAFPAATARRHFSISMDTDDTLGSYSSKFVCDLIGERDIDALVTSLLKMFE